MRKVICSGFELLALAQYNPQLCWGEQKRLYNENPPDRMKLRLANCNNKTGGFYP